MADPRIVGAESEAFSSASAPSESTVPNTTEVRVDRFLRDYDVDSIYAPRHVKWVRDNLVLLLDRSDDKFAEAILKQAVSIFEEKKLLSRHYVNVKRQEIEVRRAELRPGEIPEEEGGLTGLARQIQGQLPYKDKDDVRWKGSKHGYGDQILGTRTADNIGSVIGGTKAELDSIRERNFPIIHTKPVSPSYRNNVIDAVGFVRDDINVNALRLKTLLEEGREMTEKEGQSVRKINMAAHRASNIGESFIGVVNNLVGKAGRGLISKTDHTEDARYSKYIDRRNELISNVLWRLDPKDRGTHLEALRKVDEMMGGADILDEATFARMQQLISEQIKAEGKVSEEEIARFNKVIYDLNNEMLSDMERVVSDEDAMFKWRVLQVFLILSPLGAFSVAGELFNYIDPLAELLGPFADPSLSFGEALAEIGTSEVLGPFGAMADFFGIDDITRFLFDLPIIGDLFDAIKTILVDNSFSQEVLGVLSPSLSSPLLPLGIAGAYSLSRFDDELRHRYGTEYDDKSDRKGSNQVKKLHNKLLEKEFKSFEEGQYSSVPLEKRCRDFSNKRFDTFERMNLETKFLRFVAGAERTELEIFDGKTLVIDGKDTSILELRDKYSNDEDLKKAIATELLEGKNSEVLSSCIDNFLAFEAVDKNKVSYDNLKSNSAKFGRKVKQQKEVTRERFIVESAAKMGIIPVESLGFNYDRLAVMDSTPSAKEIAAEERKSDYEHALHDLSSGVHLTEERREKLSTFVDGLEHQLKQKDFEHLMKISTRNRDNPNPSVINPAGSKLHGSKGVFAPDHGSSIGSPTTLVR